MNSLTRELSSVFIVNEGPKIHSVVEVPLSDSAISKRDILLQSRQLEFELTVPADLKVFDGHFPGHAVFPGVVQIDWVGKLSRHLFSDLGKFKNLNNIKFTSMIFPDTRLALRLIFIRERRQVRFQYHDQSTQYSSGTLAYSEI